MQQTPPDASATNPVSPRSDRLFAAQAWAARKLGLPCVDLVPISGDASFRRYFRLQTAMGTLVLMDAPPARENSAPFIDVAERLRKAGLHAPAILHFDLEQGFGLLEDLGDTLYRDVLTAVTADRYFPDLFQVLLGMATRVDCSGLPDYDPPRLQMELDLFTEWYLLEHRHKTLITKEMETWRLTCEALQLSAAAQPQVFVHRDFHSCNLLFQLEGKPGVIDFQDAVRGPVSYDFVSLLWDRYIAWPREQLEAWMESYRTLLGLAVDPARWIRWCDLMGLQRNLKIVGIFARLHYRDHKPAYLELIPQFYRYLVDVTQRYPELGGFSRFLKDPECAP